MNKKDLENLYLFMGRTDESIDGLKKEVKEIKTNHLKHINGKINGLLFTVLSSVFIGVFLIAFNIVMQLIKK